MENEFYIKQPYFFVLVNSIKNHYVVVIKLLYPFISIILDIFLDLEVIKTLSQFGIIKIANKYDNFWDTAVQLIQ